MDSNLSVLSVCWFAFYAFAEILNAAQILAIKLFSVSPSEMYDERSASRFAFNSAKRNGLRAENLIHMAQLHDQWTYGLESPIYSHSAALHLPKAQTAPKTIPLPAPTLQGLLKLTRSHSDSFICTDPYGAQALEDDDESEAEDCEPTITRGSQVERLEIEKLIDLANPKLLARYLCNRQLRRSQQNLHSH